MSKNLFDTFRSILGRGFTQAEVDLINRALMGDVATVAKNGMRASQRGLDLIHEFESLRLSTYRDPGPTGLPITGGWGTTRDENNRPFQLGRTETKAFWDALFARDLAAFEEGVNLLIGDAPTTQGQFDAMVSFAYNVGLDIDDDNIAEGLGDSTLLKKHLRGDYTGAAAEFGRWSRAGGRTMRGLVRRRAAEAALYGS